MTTHATDTLPSYAMQGDPEFVSTPTNRRHDPGLFRQCLLDHLRDGVIFVDENRKILEWNQKLESLTGISAKKVEEQILTPELLGLADAFGCPVSETHDPLADSFRSKKTRTGDYKLVGRSGREVKVEMSFSPVLSAAGDIRGAVILVHDSSVQLDLQRQLKSLYEFSMLDPLTQVSNRAEFERALDEFIKNRDATDFECSLIICDIDYFKQINDNYNHHVGDQALVAFADMLKQHVRAQDVVARYGGEEFVILCANCDQAAAVERAEAIRASLCQTPQPMLEGKYMSASFGVAQLKPEESATEFFVRADTSLLEAKEAGRNRVVAAESTVAEEETPVAIEKSEQTEESATATSSSPGIAWRDSPQPSLICNQYRTRNPISVLVEKLRGYIIEKDAEIVAVESDFASLVVEFESPDQPGRIGRFGIELEFQEAQGHEQPAQSEKTHYHTFLRITIREGKRKWFGGTAAELAPYVLVELRRFFMINDESNCIVDIQPATEDKPRR